MIEEKNRQPRAVTDQFEAVCAHCHKVIYTETHVALTADNGEVTHEKVVAGAYRQQTDAEGLPTGPVIPFCPCVTPKE